jgi:hypothetical protein
MRNLKEGEEKKWVGNQENRKKIKYNKEVKSNNKGNEEAEKKDEDKWTGKIIVFASLLLVEAEEGILSCV